MAASTVRSEVSDYSQLSRYTVQLHLHRVISKIWSSWCNLRGFLFKCFFHLKEENIERVNIFCKHSSFLSYSQLFQTSQIFENVFRKHPDSVILQPSDKKNNTTMIGKCFHIFRFMTSFPNLFQKHKTGKHPQLFTFC